MESLLQSVSRKSNNYSNSPLSTPLRVFHFEPLHLLKTLKYLLHEQRGTQIQHLRTQSDVSSSNCPDLDLLSSEKNNDKNKHKNNKKKKRKASRESSY